MDDIEQWLDQTFGPVVTCSRTNNLDSPGGELLIVSGLPLLGLGARSDLASIDCDFSTTVQVSVVKPGKSASAGNNRFGRKGTQRCWECRRWKRKCDYDDIDRPCKSCYERGIPCRAAQKVWGERRRMYDRNLQSSEEEDMDIVPGRVSTPDDEVLSQFEGMMIQWFHRDGIHWTFHIPSPWRDGASCSTTQKSVFFHRFCENLSSKFVRNAVVLLCCTILKTSTSTRCQELELRGRFYKQAIKAIKNQRYFDIVNATYMMCHYICWSGQGRNELPKHFNGFLVAYEKLVSTTSNDEILASAKVLYGDLLNLLNAGRYGPDQTPLGRVASGNIRQFLETSSRAVEAGDSVVPCQWNAEIRFQLLRMLLNHDTTMRWFKMGNYPEMELVIAAAKSHLRALDPIFRSTSYPLLMEQLRMLGCPPFRDEKRLTFVANAIRKNGHWGNWWSLFFRGHFYFLLSALLFREHVAMEDFGMQVVDSAWTICRFVAVDSMSSVFDYNYCRLQTHALFLAGLVLADFYLQDGTALRRPC